jgi:DNA repair protein RadD
MKYELRKYQEEAVRSILRTIAHKEEGGSILCLPTGSGKSLVIAEATNRLNVHTLIVCPSREILKQNKDKLLSYIDSADIGVFSASLNTKVIQKFTLCTIGSVYKKPEIFANFGLIIIDECDLYPPDKGMFITFINKFKIYNGVYPTIIGLTATPYRMVTAKKYYGRHLTTTTTIEMLTNMAPKMWRRIIYNIDNWKLVKDYYITPLKVVETTPLIPFAEIRESSGDFALKDYGWRVKSKEERILWEIRQAILVYKSILVFCASVEQANRLKESFPHAGIVTAKTVPKERAQVIDDFKNGVTKLIFNVGVLTCGFDHPGLDCIVLLRPTKSIRLYYQMSGRAIRTCEGKQYGTLIDLTGTSSHIGRIETINIRQIDGIWHLFANGERVDGKVLYTFEKEL